LLKALASAPAGALQFATEPTDELQKMAWGMLPPDLPAELGGGKTADVLGAISGVSGGLSLPPKSGIDLTIRCASPEGAKSVHNLIRAALTAMVAEIEKDPSKDKPDAKGLEAFLTPQVEGNDLKLLRDGDAMDKQLAPAIVLSLVRAHEVAGRVRSMTQMRQLLVAFIMYAGDHNGAFPDELSAAALGPYVEGGEEAVRKLLINPRRPKLDPAYVYVKPANPAKHPGELIVLYEADHPAHPEAGLNVGFADGHCEYMTREQFENQKTKGGAGGL
jgi:prepilin-type processing-associated H-X9-DG protein